MGIQLKGIELSGYMGVSSASGEEYVLSDMGRVNSLIGPNNMGKSIVFRFLQWFMQTNTPVHGSEEVKVDDRLLWNNDQNGIICCTLSFTAPERFVDVEASPKVSEAFVHTDTWKLRWVINKVKATNNFHTFGCGLLCIDGIWMPLLKQLGDTTNVEHLTGDGTSYGKSIAKRYQGAYGKLDQEFRQWKGTIRYLDSVRGLFRAKDTTRQGSFIDGTGMMETLFQWSQDAPRRPAYRRFTSDFLAELNKFFQRPLTGLSFTSNPIILWFHYSNEMQVDLPSMGTGVQELIIIIYTLMMDKDSQRLFCLEEPESHLHPGLLKQLMAWLKQFSTYQFIVSTHSNVILDTVTNEDRVYRILQTDKGACVARPASGLVASHGILDALGLCGSSLLQTNSVIWVEGPTDRLYIRKWIALQSISSEPLQEGVDYTFAFYGGASLSHLSLGSPDLDESAIHDLISMISISRFSGVIMDRDLSPSEPASALRDYKKRIINEAQLDPQHRLALTTDGREVENDLPSTVFLAGCAAHLAASRNPILKTAATSVPTISLTGAAAYSKEIADQLGLNGADHSACIDKLEEKVSLARRVLAAWDEVPGPFPLPSYISQLIALILCSRAPERSSHH
jgi:hypothetical protein